MKFIIIGIIVLLFVRSFVNFKRRMKYFGVAAAYLQTRAGEYPTASTLLSLSAALIEIQHYKDACEILEGVAAEYPNHPQLDKIEANVAFCKHPCPGVNTLKNFNENWFHNFVLVRLGNRRFNFLSEDDLLAVNSLIRQSE
ncbi:MAG: hypothetical protein K6F33_13840 [Bacteroidales bacterium]|nr:hypothetical protein [Bacteroidales bacterium]